MMSTLHKCVHCRTISIVYLCPRRSEPKTVYEYDCHACDGLNRFVPVKCIEQAGELPDRAVCAQGVEASARNQRKRLVLTPM